MVGSISKSKQEYDLIQVVMVYIGTTAGTVDNKLLKMLHLLFRARLKAEAKIKQLRDEFDITLDNDMLKELNIMCNLSEGIAEEARAEALAEAAKLNEGIAEEAREEATLKNLRSLIKTAKVSVEQAMDMLEVPAVERTRYAELLD